MDNLLIFGAKSIALGACMSIQELYPDCQIRGFLVSCGIGNPSVLCGYPVMEAESYKHKDIPVLLGVPQNIQEHVRANLEQMGYQRIISLSWEAEADLMGRYYEKTGQFMSLKRKLAEGYAAGSHKDRPLKTSYNMPGWVQVIQAGRALSDKKLAEVTDDTGDNISLKNINYCELTALYWIWKNILCYHGGAEYYGFFQYRRLLDLTERDIWQLAQEQVDVVLPYPLVSEPCILEHHQRYVKESDWKAMMQALSEQQPDYYEKAEKIFHQQYMYNYNIIFAKKDVLKDYCQWLFPILERTEELSVPKGKDRADRYIGYLGENLLTLYFLYHKDHFKIQHTGRVMVV